MKQSKIHVPEKGKNEIPIGKCICILLAAGFFVFGLLHNNIYIVGLSGICLGILI